MKHHELTWNTFDGIKIFGQYWTPDAQDAKAVVCLVHGMGEHSSRYEHVAQYLTDNGFVLLTMDLRGHGHSKGNRGHTPSYEALLNDVEKLLDEADELFPGKKKFLYGHSMGGGLVGNFILKRKRTIAGAILSSPYFKLSFEPPKVKIMAGKLFENLLPSLSLPTGLDANHISHDVEVVNKYKNDPLVHDKISAKMGMAVIDNGQWAIDHAASLSVPTLIYHGSGDQLTSHDGSKEFAQNAGKNARFVSLKDLYHETHNEVEKEQVFKMIVDFCNGLL